MHLRKSLCRTVLTLGAAILLLNPVQAQDFDNRGNVYGGLSHYSFDNDWNQDDDEGWLIGGEMPVADRWALTVEHWQIDSSDVENAPGSADFKYTRFGPNYLLAAPNGWQTYVGAGFGHLKQSISTGGGESNNAFDIGVGVKKFFTDNLFVRGDLKTMRIMDVNNWDRALNISVGYAFGSRSQPVAATPAPAPAPAQPAPDPDSDGDGVPNSRDRCANTPRELAVDANGCPILDTRLMSQQLAVQFDFDRAEIKPEFQDEIEEFAEFMMTYSNTNVVIEGHTDSVGTEQYNQQLSERRAQAVMNRLINTHGIAASRLSAVGYGESRPVADNDTAESRARNRRIMAEVSAEVQEQRRR